jgi:hypothetical protein
MPETGLEGAALGGKEMDWESAASMARKGRHKTNQTRKR